MKKKILGAVIAFVFTLGVSIGVTSSINFKVANAENVKTVDLPSGTYVDSKIVWDLDDLITISQNKGNSQSNVSNTYIDAPRMYAGHYLRFEAVENVAITSIKIIATSTSHFGQDITYISSTESNGALAYSGTDKPSVSDGYSSMESSLEMTFIFDSSRSIVIQNSYKDGSRNYKQLRFSELEITYTSSIVTILPTQVTVDINKLEFTYAGETAQATAIVLPEEATNKKVTWSSSNNSVAEVDAHTGVVTAIGSGDANIIATCVADESITDFVNVQVSISQSYIEVDALLNHDTLKLITSGYASNNGTHKVGDFTFETEDVMKNSSSAKIQMKKSSGYITNKYNYFNTLKRISISGDVEPILEVGTTSADTIVQSIELNGYWVYDLTSYNATVFKITASSSTTYLNHIFIETTDSDVEEIRAFAVLANETLIEECNALNVQTSTWDELAGLYNSLTEGQQKILTETEISIAYSDIQQFVQRYDYIIAKYSYSNFMSRNVNMLNVSNENINDADLLIIIVVISILSVSSIALFAISKRKSIRK